MWRDEHVSYDGLSFSMPERNVLPKPVQKPHPPMWVTVTSPGTELDAADRGLGCLGVAAAGYDEQERRTEEYFRRIEQLRPGGRRRVPSEVTTLNFLYCHEDAATAAKVGMGMVGAFGLTNSHLLWTREAFPTRAYQSLGNLAPGTRPREVAAARATRTASPRASASATPTSSSPRSSAGSRSASTGINFLLNGLEVIPQEQVLESMRLFAREVMPHFPAGAACWSAPRRSTSCSRTPRPCRRSTPRR